MVRPGRLRLQGEAPQGVRLRKDPADGPAFGAVEGVVGVVDLDHAALVDALQDDEVSNGREVPCRDAADDGPVSFCIRQLFLIVRRQRKQVFQWWNHSPKHN